MYNKCKICGKPSGRYQFCYDCYFENNINDYDDYDDYEEYETDDVFEDYQNAISERINSLYVFSSIYYFNEFVENLYDIENWEITNIPDEEKINVLQNKNYFLKLKKDFNSKNLSSYPITKKEILSYLDTLSIMHTILNKIESLTFQRNASIIMEYVPKFDQGKDRCDYLITYKNILIIFEFGKCNYNNIKEIRTKKEKELNYYESMLKKITGKDTIIKTIAVVYSSGNNTNEINNVINLITHYINLANKNAIDYLIEEN